MLYSTGVRANGGAARRIGVSKRTILFLSIGAIIFYIIGVVLTTAAATAAAAGCANATTTAAASSCAGGAVGGAGIGLLLYVVGAILTLIAWIGGLIKTAKASAWGWFVLVLLLSPLGSLIYGAAGPEVQAA